MTQAKYFTHSNFFGESQWRDGYFVSIDQLRINLPRIQSNKIFRFVNVSRTFSVNLKSARIHRSKTVTKQSKMLVWRQFIATWKCFTVRKKNYTRLATINKAISTTDTLNQAWEKSKQRSQMECMSLAKKACMDSIDLYHIKWLKEFLASDLKHIKNLI